MGRAPVPSKCSVHLKGMQRSPGAFVAGGPEAETMLLRCKVRRMTPPSLLPSLSASLPHWISSPRTAPSAHTSLLRVKPGLARLDGASVWAREGRSPSGPEHLPRACSG